MNNLKLARLSFYASIALAAILFLLIVFSLAQAQSVDPEVNIQFPITELGNCNNKEECKTYCNNPANTLACTNFAEAHGLIPKAEAERARKFASISTGPGGCQGRVECDTYCSNVSHIDECVSFAETHGLMDTHEIEEARKIRQAIKSGAKLPGNCQSKQECEAYCQDDSHIDECFAFAEAAGFIPPEEIEEVKRVLPLMKRGETPGGCKSKEQCDAYCSDSSHANECADFAVKAGFIRPEEAAIIKKTGGRGPGGCQGREQCEAFCQNPNNQQACFEFGKKHGLIPPEELANIERGQNQFREALSKAPPAVLSCIESVVGSDRLAKIKTGTTLPPREIGEQIKECFENNLPKGPGGCSSREQCETFCDNNPDECFEFAKSEGHIPPEEIERIESSRRSGGSPSADFPPEVERCLSSKLSPDRLAQIKSGHISPSQEVGSAIRGCFESFRPSPPERLDPNQQPPLNENSQPLPFPSDQFNPADGRPFDPNRPPSPDEFYGDHQPAGQFSPPSFDDEFKSEFNRQFQTEFQKRSEAEFQHQFENEFNRQSGLESQRPPSESERFQPEPLFKDQPNFLNRPPADQLRPDFESPRSFQDQPNFINQPTNQPRFDQSRPQPPPPSSGGNQSPPNNPPPPAEKIGEQGASLLDIFLNLFR